MMMVRWSWLVAEMIQAIGDIGYWNSVDIGFK